MEASISGQPRPLFSNAMIKRLLIPLIIEQFLAVMVGMADTIMVVSVGEAAVSGISIVDTLNTLLINVFTALATGGVVVASQLLGKDDQERACQASEQLLLAAFTISMGFAAIALVLNEQILRMIYGSLDAEVMGYARTYFYLTACSFPFLALYNGCAAMCRSMGNSVITMKVSALMNGMHILGNAFLIFGLKMDAAGAGISTLVSRAVAAVILINVVRDERLPLHIPRNLRLKYRPALTRAILHFGIPMAMENSLFQGGKLLVAGLVSSFGTTAIAANAVSGTIASLQVIPGTAINMAVVTMVGQAIGAGRYDEAKQYTKRLIMAIIGAHALLCVPMLLGLPQIIGFYNLSPDTARLAYITSLIHGVSCVLIWPLSFAVPNALRAAGDVRFVLMVSMLSMFFCRVVLSYVLGRYLALGLVGVWLAMIADWGVRLCVFMWRILSGRWLKNIHNG